MFSFNCCLTDCGSRLRLEQLLRFFIFRALQTSCVHPLLDIRALSMNQFLNIALLSEVLVSLDKRPYRNLKFHNVLARQGSSYCIRARLNLQAFALRDMTMAAREGCRGGQQKKSYSFRFCKLNRACTKRSIFFNVSDLYSNNVLFQWQNSVTDVSVILRPPCLCPSEGHKHGFSIQSSINLGDTPLQITRE